VTLMSFKLHMDDAPAASGSIFNVGSDGAARVIQRHMPDKRGIFGQDRFGDFNTTLKAFSRSFLKEIFYE
jgi:hypothetical protein